MSRSVAGGAALIACAFIRKAHAEASLFSAMPPFEMKPSWKWVIGAALVALVVGFMIGWRTLDRRIRKKYGGLKIY